MNNKTHIIAEIGINHNGSIETALELISVAKKAGCNSVKFQKRNPDKAVPDHQKEILRETPWGVMTYLEYKKKIEFGSEEFNLIDQKCKELGIEWFVSCWDLDSLIFIEKYDLKKYKIASACLCNTEMNEYINSNTNYDLIISTGMSSEDEIDVTLSQFINKNITLLHTNSEYPAPIHNLNLSLIPYFRTKYPDYTIGYSGHETGLSTTYAAVALGAQVIERHITLDRSMWGTDQSASIEPHGLNIMVSNIRDIEKAIGEPVKVITEGERKIRRKLRGS